MEPMEEDEEEADEEVDVGQGFPTGDLESENAGAVDDHACGTRILDSRSK